MHNYSGQVLTSLLIKLYLLLYHFFKNFTSKCQLHSNLILLFFYSSWFIGKEKAGTAVSSWWLERHPTTHLFTIIFHYRSSKVNMKSWTFLCYDYKNYKICYTTLLLSPPCLSTLFQLTVFKVRRNSTFYVYHRYMICKNKKENF